MSGTDEQYNLVFEGPIDNSPDTLRRLKAALLVDMSFSIDQIQEALSTTPYTLITTSNEAELEQYAALITAAGGKTCIVKVSDDSNDLNNIEEEATHDAGDSFDLSINFEDVPEEPVKATPVLSEGALEEEGLEGDEFHLHEEASESQDSVPVSEESVIDNELDLLSEEEAPVEVKKDLTPPTAVSLQPSSASVDLSFDEDEAEAPLMKAADESTKPLESPKQVQPPSPTVPPQDDGGETVEFSFTIGDEEEEEKEKPKPKKAKSYNLSLDEAPASEIPELLEKEPVGQLVNLLARAKEKAETKEADPTESTTAHLDSGPVEPSLDEPSSSHPLLKGKGVKEENALSGSLQSRSTKEGLAITEEVKEKPTEVETKVDPVVKAHRPQRRSLGRDLLLPVLIGIPVIIGGNWLYFHLSDNQAANNVTERIQNLTKSLAAPYIKEKSEVTPEPVKHELTGEYFGEKNYDGRKLTARTYVSIEDKAIKVSGQFTTPEPAELTIEQIGKGIRKPLWIRSIDIDEEQLEINTKGEFQGQSPARIYIEDNGNSKRLAGTGKIVGKINTERKIVEATISVLYGSPQEKREFLLKQKAGGEFDVSMIGSVELMKPE